MTGRIGAVRFVARPPWWGGDLQTLRDFLWERPAPALAGGERIEFPMPDGDRLVGTLNRPAADSDRPLIVLIHGLTGCQDSFYMKVSARHFLAQGYPVLRLNLRGAGPSRALCRMNYHAGRSEDLQALLAQMDGRLARHGLLLVGFSLGGNILLKHLGEQGRRAQVLRLRTLGGLSVSRDGRVVSGALAQPRRLAVLALLARAGPAGAPRDKIVATLWPDMEDERGRHTFAQTLYAIRRALIICPGRITTMLVCCFASQLWTGLSLDSFRNIYYWIWLAALLAWPQQCAHLQDQHPEFATGPQRTSHHESASRISPAGVGLNPE